MLRVSKESRRGGFPIARLDVEPAASSRGAVRPNQSQGCCRSFSSLVNAAVAAASLPARAALTSATSSILGHRVGVDIVAVDVDQRSHGLSRQGLLAATGEAKNFLQRQTTCEYRGFHTVRINAEVMR